jgi:disulfide bond formation protein DsbB
LPPVRRGQPAVPAASAPPAEFDLAPPAAAPRGGSDPKLLYMTLALVMVSLATIALGLGWYIHSTAIVPAPQGVAVAPAAAGGGAEAPGATQSGALAPAAAAQPAPQQPGGASFSPLLLSIAFISAVLIFAAVVVLFMAVKRGS